MTTTTKTAKKQEAKRQEAPQETATTTPSPGWRPHRQRPRATGRELMLLFTREPAIATIERPPGVVEAERQFREHPIVQRYLAAEAHIATLESQAKAAQEAAETARKDAKAALLQGHERPDASVMLKAGQEAADLADVLATAKEALETLRANVQVEHSYCNTAASVGVTSAAAAEREAVLVEIADRCGDLFDRLAIAAAQQRRFGDSPARPLETLLNEARQEAQEAAEGGR